MAVKRRKTVKEVEPVIEESVVVTPVEKKKSKMGLLGWAGVVIALLCLYWWKTNSWPIVAVVSGQPIFRYAVNQEMYKQYGKNTVDALVTEKLVQAELRKGGVSVTDKEITDKLDEIKKNFATDAEFNTALTERNLTLVELKKQIGLQLGIEKLLSDKIQVSASETAQLIKQMGTLLTSSSSADREKEAQKYIKDQKLQQEINTWIEDIRAKGKVWWIGKV